MIKHIFGEFPDWAKLENPLLRYEVARKRPENTTRTRIMWTAGWVVSAFISIAAFGAGTCAWVARMVQAWRCLLHFIMVVGRGRQVAKRTHRTMECKFMNGSLSYCVLDSNDSQRYRSNAKPPTLVPVPKNGAHQFSHDK